MVPERPVGHTVDDVLEAAWPKERRRAVVRMAVSACWRIAVFISSLLVLGVAVRLVFGLVVPWTFFVFMAGLAVVGARPEEGERAHLRRAQTGGRSRPSTGCYPRTDWD